MIEFISPTYSFIKDEEFLELLNHIKLSITEKYSVPPRIITLNGTTIATLGNFSASVGKAKSMKTTSVGAIVASYLTGKEVLNFKAEVPEGKEKVLYIDTEQSKYHCHKVLERILRLAELPLDRENESIDFYVLREYSPEQRRAIIAHALENNPQYGLVIIDGIRDLLRDINNPGESLEVVNDLMRWSSYYNLHIHTVIHLNKGDDNTRGHIGTEVDNKAETILQITKSIENGSMSEVKAKYIRDKEFDPFAFRINEEGLPEIVKDYRAEISKKDKKMHFTKLTESQHREAIESVIRDNKPLGYNQMLILLQDGYSNIGYSRGRNTITQLLKYIINMGYIMKTDKTYQYVPRPSSQSADHTDKQEQNRFSLV